MLLSLIMFSLIDVCHTNSHLSWKSSWNIQPSKADVSITFVIVEHNFLSWQSVTFLTISLATKSFPRATYMDLISFTFMLLSLIMFSLIDVCHTNSHLSWKSSWNIQPSKADVSITFVIVEHNFLSWQSITFLTISLATKSFPRATYMDLISFTFKLLSLIMFSLIDVCHTNSHLSWKSSWNIQPSKADVSITFVIVEHNFLSWQSVTFLTISLATKSFLRATYMDLISFTFMLLSLIMFSLIDVCHTNSHLSWKSSWNIQPSKADVSITFVIVEHNFLSWQSVTFLTISLATKSFPRATYMDLISFTFMLLSLIMFSLIDVCHTNSHLSWKSSWNIQPSKADVSITFVIVEHNFLSWQSVTFLTISLATKSFPRATYMDLISFTFMLLSLIMFSLIDVCHTNSHLSWKSSWNIQPSKADVSITFVIVEHNFLSWQSVTFLTISLATKSFPRATYMDLISFTFKLLSLIMFSLIDVCHTNSHLSWKSSWNIQPSKADVSITFVIVEHNFLSWQSVTFLTISLATKSFPRATYMDLISFTFMLLSLIMFSLIDVCHTNSHLSWKSSWNIQPSKADVSITFV